ncbi:TetR/AcrR family transcriptional regulator [Sphingomonas sp.]|uniref:TetR/AcrR family transcriptional regulator n=1 Tax=Sphingomonas sp. TaxID=28214 RepID=UPI001B038187|nr:TetR/AcrR family transcriptional regulator [Sphingomonas sp.]MBO9715023.1 TetR/AcrR family transcriptional regulator [Sphingomonas sp.]
MADAAQPSTPRKPRADAERNRARLVAAAKDVFAEKRSAASLDEIARVAGVGIGTLYRHFPTRDALIEAVYRSETDQLAGAATRLSLTLTPVEALREWLLLFVDYLDTKHGMAEVLNSVVGGAPALYAATGFRASDAVAMLAEKAAASGTIRLGLDPLDLLRAIAGVANLGTTGDWKPAGRRMVDILIAGLRAETAP